MIVRLLVSIDLDDAALLELAKQKGFHEVRHVPDFGLEIGGSFARITEGALKQLNGVREIKSLYLPALLKVEL